MVSGVALLATSRARPMRASVAALLALTAPGGCGALDHGFLNAQGRVAAYERQLHIIISIVLLFVAGPVLLLVPLFGWHYRLSNSTDAYRPKWAFAWPIESLMWIPPIGIGYRDRPGFPAMVLDAGRRSLLPPTRRSSD